MQLFGGKKGGKHTDSSRNNSSKNNGGRTPERYDDYDYYAESKPSAPPAQPANKAQGGKKQKKKGKAGKVILIILLCLVVLLAAAYVYVEYFMAAPDSNGDGITNNDDPPVNTVDGRKPGVYTLLVAGVDVVSNNTDTIMIGRLDTVNHTLNVVSIPRDTLTNIQHEVKKANSAYHYAAYYSGIQSSSYYGCDPIEKMREELIKSFLGFDVDGYILVNMDAAEQVVDAIGGVEFEVPPGMNYDDPTQDLHIHIPEGQQKLNGEQFVQLMRFRSGYAGGDIQRIDMQHELLMAVASQMISLKNIPNLTEVISIVSDNMETSLTAENMLYYAKEFLKLDSENIKFYTMPGDTGGNVFGASYVFCDIDAWLDMVNECLNPWEAKVTTKNVNIVTYKDGNFYSTTGELSGGVSSFLNYSSSSTMGVANVYTYTSSPSTTNSGSKDDNE